MQGMTGPKIRLDVFQDVTAADAWRWMIINILLAFALGSMIALIQQRTFVPTKDSQEGKKN